MANKDVPQMGVYKGRNKNGHTSHWHEYLCQRFYLISLTLNKRQESIPLIQHYLSAGSLIIFHRRAAEREIDGDDRVQPRQLGCQARHADHLKKYSAVLTQRTIYAHHCAFRVPLIL